MEAPLAKGLREQNAKFSRVDQTAQYAVLSTSYFFVLTCVFGFSGEIPVALLRWKFVENRTAELKGNAGLMLPSNIGELGDSVTEIDLCNHNLRGGLSIRSERFIFATEFDVAFYAGPLPKVLPISLEVLTLGKYGDNTNRFTGAIPSGWGALTNLKELKMVACGLDGKPLRTRSERLHSLLICFTLFRMLAQGARKARQFGSIRRWP